MIFPPNRSLTVGVLADNRACEGALDPRGLEPIKNVARTLEIVTFPKKVMLWLLNGARSHHPAAATAFFFV